MAIYCSTDQWAIKKSSKARTYEDFDDYASYNDYPEEANLEDIAEEVTANMNKEIGCNSNVTSSNYTVLLRNICYRGMENALDLEQARSQQRPERAQFIPKDYLNERDRLKLREIGRILKHRRVARVVF